MSFADYLLERHRAHADRIALEVPGGDPWSYAELDRRSAALAAALVDLGVRAGDRVVVQVDKSRAAVALYLAVLRVGAVHVPLNPAYTDAETAGFVADADPRLVVGRPAADGRPSLPLRAAPDVDSLGRRAVALDGRFGSVGRSPDDPAAILYTSGTTGRSKGAVLSHENLRHNAEALRSAWAVDTRDTLLHALPIFHVHGLFVALHTAFLAGARVRMLPRFDARTVLDELPGCTVLMGVPTFYSRLLREPGLSVERCSNVRLFVSGSAPLPEALFERFEARTGHRILERYGMSEAGILASNPLLGDRVAGTVGAPLPGVEARVTGAAGRPASVGEIGMLEVRGPNVFGGYWRRPEATAQAFRSDGFLITGDLASIDRDGRIRIAGRRHDLVISGGFNVYPREVEIRLDAVPGVRESAVFGVPHPDLGEAVVAAIVRAGEGPEPDAEAVLGRLAGTLARFKLPRRLFWLDELPRNAMGKVLKQRLRERFAEAFFDGARTDRGGRAPSA